MVEKAISHGRAISYTSMRLATSQSAGQLIRSDQLANRVCLFINDCQVVVTMTVTQSSCTADIYYVRRAIRFHLRGDAQKAFVAIRYAVGCGCERDCGVRQTDRVGPVACESGVYGFQSHELT